MNARSSQARWARPAITAMLVVLGVIAHAEPQAAGSGPTVVALRIDERQAVLATAIEVHVNLSSHESQDGPATYFLTKDSELDRASSNSIALASDRQRRHTIERIAADRATDLALLRVVPAVPEAAPLDPRQLNERREGPPPPGTFVELPIPHAPAYRGIISGPPRRVPSDARMGLVFAQGTPRPVVAAVQPGSGADAAGLRRGDVLLALDGEPTPTPLAVIDRLRDTPRYPGDSVVLTIRRSARAGADREGDAPTQRITVTLGQSPADANQATTRVQRLEASLPRSRRASGFPSVLPTDAPVPPHHAGTPAFAASGDNDASGKQFLGMVIARASRYETLILPTAEVHAALQRMLAQANNEHAETP